MVTCDTETLFANGIETSHQAARGPRLGGKIQTRHLERQAVVYVRQSSARQVQENIESTQLQYGLVDRAKALGWPDHHVVVIDDDLGVSGQSLEGRAGFQRLLAEISLGHVGMQALGLTTLVGVVTITLSTYMILYSQNLYERLAPWLKPFERRRPHRELAVERQAHGIESPDVIIFGLGRFGEPLSQHLKGVGLSVLGVDFDPEVVRHLRRQGMVVRFGDGQDSDFLDNLPLEGVPRVVSTLPDLESNRALLHALTQRRFGGEIAIVARDEAQGAALKRAGAPTVFYPLRDAMDFTAEHLTALIRSEKNTS